MCTKKKFDSRREAKRWMKEANRSGSLDKLLTDVYKCPECGYWHMTSMNKKASRDFTKKISQPAAIIETPVKEKALPDKSSEYKTKQEPILDYSDIDSPTNQIYSRWELIESRYPAPLKQTPINILKSMQKLQHAIRHRQWPEALIMIDRLIRNRQEQETNHLNQINK